MLRMLAIDLDGTLLNEEHVISEENKQNIMKLKENGVKIILLSGRETDSILPFSEELGLKECLVGFNGGLITNYSGAKIVFEKTIDDETAKKIVKTCEHQGIYNILFIRNTIYVSKIDDEGYKLFRKFSNSKIEPVGCLSDFIEKNNLWGSIGKMLQAGKNEKLVPLREYIVDNFKEKVSSQFSLPYFLEIFNEDVGKGQALRKLTSYCNISRNEVVAIGDGENDISMLKYAGVGVAMENALPSVKSNADMVTLSNAEDGVSQAIKQLWGNLF